jgi:Tfp pilus assembly protein PilV
MKLAGGARRRSTTAQRGATLVESLIAITLSGIIVVGLLSALRTAVRSSKTTSEQAAIEGALADAAQLLDRVAYARCPSDDPNRSYQLQVEQAAASAGDQVASLSLVGISYLTADGADWAPAQTTTTATPPTAPSTTVNPIVTTVVPTVTTLEVIPTTVATTAAPTTVAGPDDGTPTTVDLAATTTTDGPPPITNPPSLGVSGRNPAELFSVLQSLGSGSRLGAIAAPRQAVDCTGPLASATNGPTQQLRLRATTTDGVTRDLVVVKSDD